MYRLKKMLTHKTKYSFIFSTGVLLLIFFSSLALCIENIKNKAEINKKIKSRKPHLIQVAPPPFSPGIFPCSACHNDMETDTTVRKLEFHENIHFTHDAKHRWCLDCHDANNRDYLHFASGKLVSFKELYKLCGQCHGPKLRDWKNGEHGKRTGEWSSHGKKQYLLCTSCHNPHSPAFKSMKPLPPPVRPEDLE